MEPVLIYCPYCGEAIEIYVDDSVEGQTYVEDCQVCCKPNLLNIKYDPGEQEFVITAQLE